MKYAFYPGCTYESAAGYKESVNAVNQVLGIKLDEIPDWNCCGATTHAGIDELESLLLGARVMALSQRRGYDHVVTGCNACYTTLRKVHKKLASNPAALAVVNRRLKSAGLAFDPTAMTIRHHLEILVNDVDPSVWKSKIVRDFKDVKVAGYYGCQLTRPWNDLRPQNILERLIALAGFTPVDHSARTLCCGAALAVPYEADTRPLIKRIITGVTMAGADLMTTVCPLCQLNMDQGQTGLANPDPKLAVTYYSQLAGLGLGISPDRLALDKLLIPVNKELVPTHEN
ncbi:MAG: CoB--CoM heterodisulfide reductase iron-sulfur subunit B family protein [Pseudomonadota bacterium]